MGSLSDARTAVARIVVARVVVARIIVARIVVSRVVVARIVVGFATIVGLGRLGGWIAVRKVVAYLGQCR